MPQDSDLRAFGAEVVASYRAARRSPRTIAKMTSVLAELARTVSPSADRPALVADLTTAGIARWMALACPQRAANTVIGLLGYVRAACSYAVEEGLLDRQPAWRRLRPRRARARAVRHHPAAQIAALLGHLEGRAGRSWQEHRLYFLVALVALTGLRRDEALWLPQVDLHPAQGYLDVEPHHRRPLKTEGSAQPVPMPPELVPIARAWLAENCRREWAVPAARGTGPWWGGSPGYRPIDKLKAAGEEIGLQGLTFQTLRRSWATHAESKWGLTDPEIMRVLRHSTPETSRRHYREADLANLQAIASRVGYRR